jgi:hypothetical protein
MTSKRKDAKLRKMEVKKVLKQIDKYTKQYRSYYGDGYYLFSFGSKNFNLHIVFDKCPLVKFAIWKCHTKWYYFAECLPYIDKFKPGHCAFEWDNFDDMMNVVKSWLKDHNTYVNDLERAYCSESEYFPSDYQEILEDHQKELYRRSHNWFDTPEEYGTYLKNFKQLVASLDTKYWDIFWRKSDGYKNLYDVWLYAEDTITNEEYDEMLDKFRNDCKCFCFGTRPLPPHFFKKPWLYKYKIHPDNHSLFFNQKKHIAYFYLNK